MFKFRSSERLDKLETAFERLDTRLEGLRTLPKKLELEWEETLDKLSRLTSRLNQRARRDALAGAEGDELPEVKGTETPLPANAAVGDHEVLSGMRRRVFRH